MAGNDKEMGGAAITLQEMLEHVATLAGLGYENAERAALLHDEVQRCLNGLSNAYNQSQQRVQALAEDLHRKYAPAAVEAAAMAAQRACAEFERSVQAAMRETRLAFWMRTVGVAMVGLVLIAAMVSLVVWWVPSLDEIKQRRAEAAELDRRLAPLRGALQADGKTWVPIIDTGKVCAPPNSGNCATYGRLK